MKIKHRQSRTTNPESTTASHLWLVVHLFFGLLIAGPLIYFGWRTGLQNQAEALGGALLLALGGGIFVACMAPECKPLDR